MASAKAPPPPVKKPAAPAAKAPPPKPAGKPAAPPPKAAAPAAGKAPPPRAAGAAPKPAAPATPKPGAPAPKAAPTAKPAPVAATAAAAGPKYVPQAEFDKLVEALTGAIEQMGVRIAALEAIASGYNQFTSVDASGAITLDLDNADPQALREWAYQFNECDWNADAEDIRAHFKAERAKKTFKGWTVVNELPIPEAEEAEETEQVALTEDAINAMNWTELTECCDANGIDYSDIKGKAPKPLRARLIETLIAAQAEPEAAEEATEGEEEGGLSEGDAMIATDNEGNQHECTFVRVDDDDNDNYIVLLGGDETSVPVAQLSMPA